MVRAYHALFLTPSLFVVFADATCASNIFIRHNIIDGPSAVRAALPSHSVHAIHSADCAVEQVCAPGLASWTGAHRTRSCAIFSLIPSTRTSNAFA